MPLSRSGPMTGCIVECTIKSTPCASFSTCADVDVGRGGAGRSLPASADHFELWPRGVPVPARLHEIGKAVGVVGMHVREEDRVKLSDIKVHLRQPQRRAASGIELQFHRAAVAAVVAIAHKSAGAGDAVEQHRAAHGASQGDKQAGCCLKRRRESSQPCAGHEHYRKEEPLHIHSSDDHSLMIKTAEVGPGRQDIELSLREPELTLLRHRNCADRLSAFEQCGHRADVAK